MGVLGVEYAAEVIRVELAEEARKLSHLEVGFGIGIGRRLLLRRRRPHLGGGAGIWAGGRRQWSVSRASGGCQVVSVRGGLVEVERVSDGLGDIRAVKPLKIMGLLEICPISNDGLFSFSWKDYYGLSFFFKMIGILHPHIHIGTIFLAWFHRPLSPSPEEIALACRAVAPAGDEVEVGVDSRGRARLDSTVVFEWYRPHYRLLMKSVDDSALLIFDWYI
jgi:hypothetical protein